VTLSYLKLRIHNMDQEIIQEIIRSLVLLGAKSDLLGSVCSWGDTIEDNEVLAGIKACNDEIARQLHHRLRSAENSEHPTVAGIVP